MVVDRAGAGLGYVTPTLIKVLYDLNNGIVLVARLPQIHQNYKVRADMPQACHQAVRGTGLERWPCLPRALCVVGCSVPEPLVGLRDVQSKSTGQLSGTMYAANFLGCIARIFTSLQEGGGYAMVRGYLLGAVPAMHNFSVSRSRDLVASRRIACADGGFLCTCVRNTEPSLVIHRSAAEWHHFPPDSRLQETARKKEGVVSAHDDFPFLRCCKRPPAQLRGRNLTQSLTILKTFTFMHATAPMHSHSHARTCASRAECPDFPANLPQGVWHWGVLRMMCGCVAQEATP